jgi:cobalt-zinc-cadmium efflux system outer membrane protein
MNKKETINSQIRAHKRKTYALVVIIFLVNLSSASAQIQQTDTLKLSRQQFEELFLKQNLLLMAEKFNVNQADALLLQAKLWPNPSISVDEVNLWSTKKQLTNLDNPLPPIFGNFVKNTQFAVQIEQLIQTAGKRKKLMAMEEVSVDLAKQQLEDLLRNLKFEFRNNLTHLQYLQLYRNVFIQQQVSVQNLLKSYQRHVDNENISQGEFIRLKGLQLELSRELNELAKESNKVETELKVLLNITGSTSLFVAEEDFIPQISTLKEIHIEPLYKQALEYRPDVKIADLENSHYARLFNYEKAQRVPNLHIMSGYNRGGGIWPSFIGFGLAIDLPLFDRNQGHIKYAKLGMDQTKILLDEKHARVKAEVSQGYKDLLGAIALYESIEPQYEETLDQLLRSYTRNFASRNISLLEYLDFQSAYLENKKIILESQRDINLHLEELHYTTGVEIKNHEQK